MAVTLSPRLGITRWSDSAADPITRAQLDADHAALDNLAARDEQGTNLGRPGPAVRGRYYFATDAPALYRDDGATWTQVATIPAANYFTGAVSVNGAAVTPAAPAAGAPFGVNRNVTGGAVFLTLKNFAVSGAATWGIGTYTAGELAVGTSVSGGLWTALPAMLLTTTGILQVSGESSLFGAGLVSGSGKSYVGVGSFSGTTQAQVRSQGTAANVDLALLSQGTGSVVWLQPAQDTTKGVKVGTTGSTFLQRITVNPVSSTDGGISVFGSPNGYQDELAFTGVGAGQQSAITTQTPGAGSLNFDHRGTSNTGQWVWRNGTGAGTTRLTLTGAGHLVLTSDVVTTLAAGAVNGLNLWGTGLAYVADSASLNGAVTAGAAIAVSRTAPALAVTNGGGDAFRTYGSGNVLEFSIGNTGDVTVYNNPGVGTQSGLIANFSFIGNRRLELGAADSAGVGYRWVRVPN